MSAKPETTRSGSRRSCEATVAKRCSSSLECSSCALAAASSSFARSSSWARSASAGAGRELRSRDEVRAYIKELVAGGRFVDPRAYGVEPHGGGLVVLGTLAMVGPGGFSETDVYWAFCFRGELVSLAAGYDRREEAIETLRTQCPS